MDEGILDSFVRRLGDGSIQYVADVQVMVYRRNVREVQTTSNCRFPIRLGTPCARDLQLVQPYSTSSLGLDEWYRLHRGV